MRQRGRGAIVTAAVVAITALMATTAACSTSRDTQQIGATANPKNKISPSTSIVVGSVPTTSTIPKLDPNSVPAAEDTLTALLSQFAIDPALLSQISALANGTPDLDSVARLLGIDLGAIQDLGLTVEQVMSLGETAMASPNLVKDQLVQAGTGGAVDPAVLVGLLGSSLDLNTLAQGTVGSLVQALTQALGEMRLEITPGLSDQLNQLFQAIDPEGLGKISTDPANSSLLALIASAVLTANPTLTQELVSNPLLDPTLKSLLGQLQSLGGSLSDAAMAALVMAISQLVPGLIPPGAIPGT